MQFKLGELFCGPGGLAYGALNAKIKDENFYITHEWANDYDFDTCETYRHNICPNDPSSVIHGDIRNLDLSSLSEIDALAFGFPCNDYSVVGEQKGIDGNYGPLYSYGIKALYRFQPKWFLAENVGGLRNANEGRTFQKILKEMETAGYTLYPHLYKFEEYGIPQARHRIIIVGIRNDLKTIFRVPSPDPYKNIDNTCKNAIENPPITEDALNNELTKQSEAVINRLNHIRPGENAFTADLPENLKLNVVGARISQIYKRLDPTKPSYTVTGSGGGGTHIYHWSEPRALTNRERARLQTFPDNYFFLGNKESVRKQIGMAVPCNGAKIIFEAILNSFANIKYPYVECNAMEYLNQSDDKDIKWEIDSNLEEKILFNPISEGADELHIISAYASPSMVSWHISNIKEKNLSPIKIKLIIGMCPFDGLTQIYHKGFQLLCNQKDKSLSKFSCQYVYKTPPIHAKTYIWYKKGKPFKAFNGSANYTLKGFSKISGEFMTECSLSEADEFYNNIEARSIYCTDIEVENYIRIYKDKPKLIYDNSNDDGLHQKKLVTLSLLSKNGSIAKSSGLNWGQRPGRTGNEAYIPLPSSIKSTGFFPLNKRHFTVITDDDTSFILRVEQGNDKAITTPENNSLLGEYIRNRLGVELGKPVTKRDLERYGRKDITFYKLDDEQYYMDFSVSE